MGLACSVPELDGPPVVGEEADADPPFTADPEKAGFKATTTEVVVDEVEGVVDVERVEDAAVVVSASDVVDVTSIDI